LRLQFGIALLTAWTLNAQGPIQLLMPVQPQRESAFGQQLAKGYRLHHAPLDSAAVRDYIDQMGQRLAAAMPNYPPFDYQFEATADFTGTFLEPVSYPGGYVFIPAGLILEARNEAEFAGMLAHAMAHIWVWHYAGQETRSRSGQKPTVPVFFVWNSGTAALAPAATVAYEPEADRLAVQFAASAGYDPSGLATFIARVQPAQAVRNALVGYPPRDERIRTIQEAIRALPRQKYASSADFASIQREVRQLAPPPPAPPKQPTLKR
jgi:predicted Zn-dependent protease